MVPQTKVRKPRNSSKINLIISLVFHGLIIVALVYFAAREGVLGKQLKKLAVQMVKEKPPDKPKTPDKPKEEPPKVDVPKLAVAPKLSEPREQPQATTTAVAPPASAPPATEIPNIVFGGGRTVDSADPVTVYKGAIEEKLKANWNKPEDMADSGYVAQVDISVSPDGQLSNPVWEKGSGNQRWDDSVKAALTATTSMTLPPPKNFPSHVQVVFDLGPGDAQPIMP
jgi:outer membrane biosynthesis protein TonB